MSSFQPSLKRKEDEEHLELLEKVRKTGATLQAQSYQNQNTLTVSSHSESSGKSMDAQPTDSDKNKAVTTKSAGWNESDNTAYTFNIKSSNSCFAESSEISDNKNRDEQTAIIQEFVHLGLIPDRSHILEMRKNMAQLNQDELLAQARALDKLSRLMTDNKEAGKGPHKHVEFEPIVVQESQTITVNTHYNCFSKEDLIVMCGNLRQLGSWIPENSSARATERPVGSGNWSVSVSVPKDLHFQWKWCILGKNGHAIWERGAENRRAVTGKDKFITAPWETPICKATSILKITTHVDISQHKNLIADAVVGVVGDSNTFHAWTKPVLGTNTGGNQWEIKTTVQSHTKFKWKLCICSSGTKKVISYEQGNNRQDMAVKPSEAWSVNWRY